MRVRGVLVVKETRVSAHWVGMHISINSERECVDVRIVHAVNECEAKGFDTLYVDGLSAEALCESCEAILDADEDLARNGGTVFPDEPHWTEQCGLSNVIHVDFKARRLA